MSLYQKPKILIFGIGGHGWIAISKFLEREKYEFSIYNGPMDWGGSTGVWGRILELNNHELNLKLHGNKSIPNFAWGDYSKFMQYYFGQKYGKAVADIFNARSLFAKDLLPKVHDLIELLAFEHEWIKEINDYFTTSLNYLDKNQKKLDYLCPVAVANILFSFLLYKLGSMSKLNLYWHKLGIIPWNISYYFSHTDRIQITGKDSEENYIKGEDIMDKHTDIILPDSTKAKPMNNGAIGKYFLQDIQEARYILIPNGSVLNWVPLVNLAQVRNKLTGKDLLWLINPTITLNEFPWDTYYRYLECHGIKPLVIGIDSMKHNPKLGFGLKINPIIEKTTGFVELNTFNYCDDNLCLDRGEVDKALESCIE